MEEKRKVGLITYILILVIIVLVAGTGLMYAEMKKTEEKVTELTEKISDLEDEKKEAEKEEITEGVKGIFIDYSKDTTIVEDGNANQIQGENSLKYSLLKEFNDDSYEKYYPINKIVEGDSAAWEEIESNYENSNPIKVGKYTETIECNIAVLNESVLYAENYNDNMTLKEKATLMADVIKDNDIYKDDIYKLNGISIMNGNNNSEDDYNNNSRAKKIKVTVNDEKSYVLELEDTNKPQVFDIGFDPKDISELMNIKIEVLEMYQGLEIDDIYINEVAFGIDYGGLGAR